MKKALAYVFISLWAVFIVALIVWQLYIIPLRHMGLNGIVQYIAAIGMISAVYLLTTAIIIALVKLIGKALDHIEN